MARPPIPEMTVRAKLPVRKVVVVNAAIASFVVGGGCGAAPPAAAPAPPVAGAAGGGAGARFVDGGGICHTATAVRKAARKATAKSAVRASGERSPRRHKYENGRRTHRLNQPSFLSRARIGAPGRNAEYQNTC